MERKVAMKDQYLLNGPTEEIKVVIERDVADKLKTMAEYTKMKPGEIVNTAIRRFIANHKDFFPVSNK